MSLDPRSWRPRPLLPPPGLAGLTGLCLGAALVSLMAVMAVAWLSADLRARPAIRARLTGGATIAVVASRTPGDLESLDAAAWRAREILAATRGVTAAHVLTPEPGDKAIAAAMGTGGAPTRLIAVTLSARAAFAAPRAIRALSREGLTAAADDHNPVSGPVERALTLDVAILALAGGGLIAILAGLTAAMIRQRGRRLTPRMTLLIGLGMTDVALLGHLLRPVMVSVSLASLIGGTAAIAVMGLAAPRPPGLAALIPAPGVADLILAAAWPAGAVVATFLAAAAVGVGRIRRIAP